MDVRGHDSGDRDNKGIDEIAPYPCHCGSCGLNISDARACWVDHRVAQNANELKVLRALRRKDLPEREVQKMYRQYLEKQNTVLKETFPTVMKPCCMIEIETY
jgi:hypothetical protein